MADLESYATLLAAATDYAGKVALLQFIRRRRLRYSEVVVLHGGALLSGSASKLGNEAWPLREQVFQAALDVHDLALAETCLMALREKFPDSMRVLRLVGLQKEAMEDYKGALEIYDLLVEDNAANGLAHKRKICVLKAKGDKRGAMEAMNTYLDTFGADTVAWQECADMHLKEGNLRQAMYCYEELLLAEPVNHMFHVKYAEMAYSVAAADGVEAYRTARSHYAQALQLNGQDFRAIVGLMLATQAVATAGVDKGGKGGESKEDDAELNMKLCTLAAARVDEALGKAGAAMAGFVGNLKNDALAACEGAL
jgi:tetratricopeptide (TPR) repeat protein